MSATTGIEAGEEVGAALLRFGRDILAEAQAAMEAAGGPKTVIHDFRKAMKRWRAFLRLLEPVIGPACRNVRIEARDLARELAIARDIQAALDALEDLEACATPLPLRAMAAVRARVEARHQSAHDEGLTADVRRRIEAYVDRCYTCLDEWPLARMRFSDIAAGVARAYGRAQRLVPEKWDEAEVEVLHDLRQRVVILRYQIELMQPLWPRYIRVSASEAQRLRERLGHCQDLAVLDGLTQPKAALARWRKRLSPCIAERKAVHLAAAARHAGRLFTDRPKSLRRKLEGLRAAADAVRSGLISPGGRP